jgi:hypothetical protein
MLRASLPLLFAFVTACVSTPDDAASLGSGAPLVQRSDAGLVQATVTLGEHELSRGPHTFMVDLSALDGSAQPELLSFEAAMPGHGHRVSAGAIDATDSAGARTYHVQDLDLFMSGRWQVTLGVELDDRSDSVEFALDVP